MKHNIRLKEPLKGDWQAGDIIELDCELGSGIKDKNGREIFEGDTVIITQEPHYEFKCKAVMRLWASDDKLWFDSKHWKMEIVD